VNPRPIVVLEASPRAPTVTVRCRPAGPVFVREVTVDTLFVALGLFELTGLISAPRGVGAEASEVRATGPGADVEHPTALERGATTSGAP
jgi:hypothetical protein